MIRPPADFRAVAGSDPPGIDTGSRNSRPRPGYHRAMRPLWKLAPIALFAVLAASCAGPLNFRDASGPRYTGCCVPPAAMGDSLRVVTFNIQYALNVERAVTLFERTPELRDADVVFLQEMDVVGTRQFAHALGYNYVYYPATVHPKTGRPFGDAILARWPIEDDKKILLPHLGRFGKTQRIAVAGTIRVDGRAIRLYSVHLATGVESRKGWKADQTRAIAADADTARADAVIIGGDFNSEKAGKALYDDGYAWVSRGLPPTAEMFLIDHVFLRGVDLTRPDARGVIEDNLGASDHKPLWVTVDLGGRYAPGLAAVSAAQSSATVRPAP
jgi:endonuclease/exonuclease/phosphatase family metal-dependent hydrolase